MLLFYAPDINTLLELPEKESQHCVRVLRKQIGDIINITDGKGYFYEASITDANPKHCKVEIINKIKPNKAWNCKIEIAIAPTKNIDRIEWFAEKATEIGIDKITFLKTRYSERKEIKLDRIEKILISAMKQSVKAILPELSEMTDFKKFVTQKYNGQKFIAHCVEGERQLLSSLYNIGEDSLILIGPEGDFSEEEVALALDNGFKAISLGESRLRTETAALTACQTIHIINQLKQ
ncbi:16S rRNA (uracil1498-N3)-methyltransferase [Dysgonomonadaceae bacterium PH5-43]|nr:16S rRNA (uracil1498-N3)-methyltransferase [Dysgonomonadaceae bacterium PH5-43]